MAHIGIVGCSPPGAALCYQLLCARNAELRDHSNRAEVSLHSHPFDDYMRFIEADQWSAVADLLLSSAEKLARMGADFCIAPCNTIHLSFAAMGTKSSLPWLHIAEEVAREASRRGYEKIALVGTNLIMEASLYPSAFASYGIKCKVPEIRERETIDELILNEMVRGRFTCEARAYILNLVERFRLQDCDAIGLGCTELPILLERESLPLPTLDSTKILAEAAWRTAMIGSPVSKKRARSKAGLR